MKHHSVMVHWRMGLGVMFLSSLSSAPAQNLVRLDGQLQPYFQGTYLLTDAGRIRPIAVLEDPNGGLDRYLNSPGRFLCRSAGFSFGPLPVYTWLGAQPGDFAFPAGRNYYLQGPLVFSGNGHTVLGSKIHNDPDLDKDGMPTTYEDRFGLNPAVDDGGLDPDGDQVDNFSESVAGTDPNDINSFFHVTGFDYAQGLFFLQWSSVNEKSYVIERSIELTDANIVGIRLWQPNSNDPAAAAYAHPEEVSFVYDTLDITHEPGGSTVTINW